MKAIELRLIGELVKDCRRSDRDLAKALGVSQPTISRIRTKLEKEGIISEYTAIPDFRKLGYEMLIFTLAKRDLRKHPYDIQLAKKFHEMNPTFIFGAGGESSNYDRIGISIQKNYGEYNKFMSEGKALWGNGMSINSFIVDLKSETIVQPLSFKTFADQLLKDAEAMQSEKKQYQNRKEK